MGALLFHRFISRLPIFLGLLLAGGYIGSAAESNPAEWKWSDPRDLGISGLAHMTFKSASMDRTVGYQIYLPPQYESEPDRRFPVVYFLHGAGGTESSDAGLAARVDSEVKAGGIAPVIYVFPNGGQRSGYRDSSTNYVRSETMLIRELLPLVDRNYRTMNQPQARGICGFSMGGGGAMRLALKYPELFGEAASLAAALDQSVESGDGDNCYVHAATLEAGQRESLRLYFVIGDEDFLYPRHQPFLARLKELGISCTLVVHSDVGHNLGTLNQLSADSMIRHLDREQRRLLKPNADG